MYLDRRTLKNQSGKTVYQYLVECPCCKEQRWQWKANGSYCKSCAGTASYTLPTKERKDKRKHGNGYITKQGYHLVFDGKSYVPAHRLAFPNLPEDSVVHHIDGDKLNNLVSNLVVLTKKEHRELHGQLEKLSYSLIQAGLIEFDTVEGHYRFSTPMQKCIGQYSVNSGKILPSGVEDNPEPSPFWGRCNDYPYGEYIQVDGSAEHPNT